MYLLFLVAAFVLMPTVQGFCGGKETSIKSHPYNVVFVLGDTKYCNGAIIADRWVITTIDKCVSLITSDWKVRAGSCSRTQNGSLHEIEEIIKHDRYMNFSSGPVNDIALVKVNTPFVFDETRQSIELFKVTEELNGGTAKVSGFGWFKDSSNSSESDNLQSIEVFIMDLPSCKKLIGESYSFTGVICVQGRGSAGFYKKDEGDPVVVNGRLGALVSKSHECYGLPTLCTEIANYRYWIDEHAFGIKPPYPKNPENATGVKKLSGGLTIFYLLFTIYLLMYKG